MTACLPCCDSTVDLDLAGLDEEDGVGAVPLREDVVFGLILEKGSAMADGREERPGGRMR